MNRAERRARKHWGQDGGRVEFGAALESLSGLSAQIEHLMSVSRMTANRLTAAGGATPAQADALLRWDIPSAAALRRATEDLRRMTDRLAVIVGPETA